MKSRDIRNPRCMAITKLVILYLLFPVSFLRLPLPASVHPPVLRVEHNTFQKYSFLSVEKCSSCFSIHCGCGTLWAWLRAEVSEEKQKGQTFLRHIKQLLGRFFFLFNLYTCTLRWGNLCLNSGGLIGSEQ